MVYQLQKNLKDNIKKKTKKLTSIIRLIVNIFLTQLNKNQFQDKHSSFAFSLPIFLPKHKIKKTKLKFQTQNAHNLSELSYLKTI